MTTTARGGWAEAEVAAHLQRLGVLVLERNVRAGRLEIDVLALEGRTLCVVEVRYRGPGALQSGFGSISALKRRRIRRAGERLWQRRFRSDPRVDRLRFDAAVVVDKGGVGQVEYVRAAF